MAIYKSKTFQKKYHNLKTAIVMPTKENQRKTTKYTANPYCKAYTTYRIK